MSRGGLGVLQPTYAPSAGLTCLFALLLSACDAGDTVSAATSCGVAGRVQSCRCPSSSGRQICEIDGDWTVCECEADISGSGTSGQGGTAGSSSHEAGSGAIGTAGTGNTNLMDGGDGTDSMVSNDLDASMMLPEDSGPAATLYRKCSSNGDCTGDQERCDVANSGGGFGTGGGSNGSGLGYCTVACMNGSACPAPPGATALAGCSNGVCALTCSVTLTCPDTLLCVNYGPAGICAAF